MGKPSKGKGGKPRGKPFPKGKTGNPGGRPRLTAEEIEVRAYAKTFTKEGIDILMEIARKQKGGASARVSAVNSVLDRGHGKPTTPIEIEAKVELKGVTVHIAGRSK